MPPDADCPGLGAEPPGPPPSAPATVEGAVGRGPVLVVAVVVAFPPELLVIFAEPVAETDPVDPVPEADPDWLAELGAAVMVDELFLG